MIPSYCDASTRMVYETIRAHPEGITAAGIRAIIGIDPKACRSATAWLHRHGHIKRKTSDKSYKCIWVSKGM